GGPGRPRSARGVGGARFRRRQGPLRLPPAAHRDERESSSAARQTHARPPPSPSAPRGARLPRPLVRRRASRRRRQVEPPVVQPPRLPLPRQAFRRRRPPRSRLQGKAPGEVPPSPALETVPSRRPVLRRESRRPEQR